VIDKPAGMVVHPAAGHASGTLVNALLHHVRGLSGIGGAERPGVVHRLDRGTSGVMVVAKHDRAHRALSQQFHDRDVVKEYVALVWGTARAGRTFEGPIGRDPKHRQKMSTRARRARPALTRVIEVEALRGVSLVHVSIGTGRTHQIRVHLSEAGHPIVGDALYGGVRRRVPAALAAAGRLDRPFLHASRLTFAHPSSGAPMTFEAPLPPDLLAVVDTLRRRAH
jgi:23S rRNA pseudouridine1911/1915/1917 synthase